MDNLLSYQICSRVCSMNSAFNNYTECKGKLNIHCTGAQKCIIHQKSVDQKKYIVSSIDENVFLKACPGSGKTEVLGIKIAYELSNWNKANCGMAILTFTNSAEDEMRDRITKYLGKITAYPHFVGTFTSWLHGYISNPFLLKSMGYKGNNGDYSLRLVENNTVADFLYSFRTKYKYGELRNIAANRYYYSKKEGKYVFSGNDHEKSIFASFTEAWQKHDFDNTKYNFWQSGFFTYEDIEIETLHFLEKRTDVAKYISNRFPIIIVDECQDLSLTQIGILNALLECGTKLHFIGDLNQSIYGFRYIYPEDTKKYISSNKFDVFELANNYRSCQKITDVSKSIVLDESEILGKEDQKVEFPLIAYLYEKDKEQKMIADFLNMVVDKGLRFQNIKVLVRNDKLKNKLYNSKKNSENNVMECYASALYIFCSKNGPRYFNEAMEEVGKATAKTFFGDVHVGSKMKLFCPQTISIIRWRKILFGILNSLDKSIILNYSTLTWKEWKKELSNELSSIAYLIPELRNKQVQLGNLRKNCGEKRVIDYLIIKKTKNVKLEVDVSTIHGSKGLTLDAVLVVSSYSSTTNNDGSGAHWKEWFNNTTVGEKNRLAYVAFSRPRYLLALGIPGIKDFSEDDRNILVQHGFKIME